MRKIAAICLLVLLGLTCFAVSGCSLNAKPIPTPEVSAPTESSSPSSNTEVSLAPTPYSSSEIATGTDATPETSDDISSDTSPEADNPAVTATTMPTNAPEQQPSPEAEIITGDAPEGDLPSSYDAGGGGIELPEIEY